TGEGARPVARLMAEVAKARRTWGLVLSPEDAADAAARAVVRHHLRAFTESGERARAGEVEPIHQLRVSTRRLRATLRLFEPVLLRPLLRAVLRSGGRLSAESSPAALHRLRIRVKRLRYAVETLGGLGGKSMRKLLRQLVRLQDLLGEHQDAVTIAARLRAL